MSTRRTRPPVLLLASLGLAACTTTQSVEVESYPPGARILVDGRDTGRTTPSKIELSTGEEAYSVQLQKNGYNRLEIPVTMTTDVDVMGPEEVAGRILCAPCCLGLPLLGLLKPIEVTDQFRPSPIIAKLEPEGQGLRLFVEPEGAEIYVDGRLRRLLDGSFLVMEPGDHELEITAPGCRPWNRVVYVSSLQYNDLDVELPPDGQGFVFDVQTPDVKLFVDDQYRGVLGRGKTRIRADVGPHQVRASKDGFEDFDAVLIVEQDQYRDELLRLERAGQGIVVMRPEGVRRGSAPQILVDGVLRGSAFDQPVQLEPGTYLVEVKVANRRDFSLRVEVVAGQYQTLDLGGNRDY